MHTERRRFGSSEATIDTSDGEHSSVVQRRRWKTRDKHRVVKLHISIARERTIHFVRISSISSEGKQMDVAHRGCV